MTGGACLPELHVQCIFLTHFLLGVSGANFMRFSR